jgi:hypothetical protein
MLKQMWEYDQMRRKLQPFQRLMYIAPLTPISVSGADRLGIHNRFVTLGHRK